MTSVGSGNYKYNERAVTLQRTPWNLQQTRGRKFLQSTCEVLETIRVRNTHHVIIQELAITLFSQVTNASACETNWSDFEYIYSKRRNRLSSDKAIKLVYVHSNLKLLNNICNESPIWTGTAYSNANTITITLAMDFLNKVDKNS